MDLIRIPTSRETQSTKLIIVTGWPVVPPFRHPLPRFLTRLPDRPRFTITRKLIRKLMKNRLRTGSRDDGGPGGASSWPSSTTVPARIGLAPMDRSTTERGSKMPPLTPRLRLKTTGSGHLAILSTHTSAKNHKRNGHPPVQSNVSAG
jgi:hypothetical protein